MKMPKWKTDPIWALRRAKRTKQKLPREVEELFKENPSICLDYVKIINEELPQFLIDSICESFEKKIKILEKEKKPSSEQLKKTAVKWIINYYTIAKGKLNNSLVELFVKLVESKFLSRYSWAPIEIDRLCSKIKESENEVDSRLENLIWSSNLTAASYSIRYKVRIPESIEEDLLLQFTDHEFNLYIDIFFKEKLPQNIESLFLKRPIVACNYAKNNLFGKLPENIHSSLIMLTFSDCEEDTLNEIKSYLNFVEKLNNSFKRLLVEFEEDDTISSVLRKIG